MTVFVMNYKPGAGKIVIECFGKAWAYYWGGMSGKTLQQFFITCDNGYILNKLIANTQQTDFDEINRVAQDKGLALHVESDVEVAMQPEDMVECFGADWYMDLPQCYTTEYHYLGKVVDVIKEAFSAELEVLKNE